MFRLLRLIILAVIAMFIAIWISNRAEAASHFAFVPSSLTSKEVLYDH